MRFVQRAVIALALVACGGSTLPSTADGGTESSSGGSGGGSSGGATSSGGTTPGDPGRPPPGFDGGGPGDPGSSSGSTPAPTVVCGSATCDTKTQDCCDARGSLSCVSKGTCQGAALTCTSSAGCPSGEVCCLAGAGPGEPPTSSCRPGCGGGGPGRGQQLCTSDAECRDGLHCFKDSAGLGLCLPL